MRSAADKSSKPRGLYVITAPELHPALPVEIAVEAALLGGARWVQYRDKLASPELQRARARQLRECCTRYGARLIINDEPDLALDCAADGVHLGRHDPDPAAARRRLGEQAIIGVSCYNSLALAQTAVDAGASYVAFGSFFASPTKPDALRAQPSLLSASAHLGVPRVAIGGILPENAAPLLAAGADLLAVISGVFASTDIRAAARAYSRLMQPTDDDNNEETTSTSNEQP